MMDSPSRLLACGERRDCPSTRRVAGAPETAGNDDMEKHA